MFFGIWLQALKPKFDLVVVYIRFMVINLSEKSRMVISVQAKKYQQKNQFLALF